MYNINYHLSLFWSS